MKQYLSIVACVVALLPSCKTKHTSAGGWTDSILVEVMKVDSTDAATERKYVGDVGSEQEATLSFVLGGRLTKEKVKQ